MLSCHSIWYQYWNWNLDLLNIFQIIALSIIETGRNNTWIYDNFKGHWLSTFNIQREREKKTQRAEPDGKKIRKKVEDCSHYKCKISEKGPSHEIWNNIKHWQDLPAPRKILRGRRGRERRQCSQQSQLPVTCPVLNQDAEELFLTAW